MNYKNKGNMRTLFFIITMLLGVMSYGQSWVTDDNFNEKVIGTSAFDSEEDNAVIVVEFYAEFNKDNAFKEWDKIDKLEGVKYYRIDIATSPKLKKELRIRMAPTLLIYVKGDAYIKFTAKAGLDLKCPVDYDKLVRAISVVKEESQY